jgi:hypothetical protein
MLREGLTIPAATPDVTVPPTQLDGAASLPGPTLR